MKRLIIRFIFYWKLNVIFVCRKQNVKMIIEYPQTSHVGTYWEKADIQIEEYGKVTEIAF